MGDDREPLPIPQDQVPSSQPNSIQLKVNDLFARELENSDKLAMINK